MKKLIVHETSIQMMEANGFEYICLTDMMKAKDGAFFVTDWLRNRNTLEYIGIWEQLTNPSFNYGEFAIIKTKAGLNNFKISVKDFVEQTNAISLQAKPGRYGGTLALFGKTARAFKKQNADFKGMIRDAATIEQLICLINLENLNALFIQEGLTQAKRIVKLNQIAIQQLTLLQSKSYQTLENLKKLDF
jgi:hypothetical protein